MKHTNAITPNHALKLKGVRCPDFIESVRNYIRSKCVTGDLIYIESDEPSSGRDISKYCQFLEHDLVHKELGHPLHIFVIRKG